MWGKSLKEREALEKELEGTRAARLEVAVGTSGAVELSLCKLNARLRREFDRGVFALDAGGDLVFTGGDGTPQLLARLA